LECWWAVTLITGHRALHEPKARLLRAVLQFRMWEAKKEWAFHGVPQDPPL
jgi:hypothetical protein